MLIRFIPSLKQCLLVIGWYLTCFAIEGYTHKEISELLNITENTSKSQLRKARINIIERINKTKQYGNS